MKTVLYGAAVGVLATAALGAQAWAQSAPPAGAAATGLEEVVVTAQRRTQSAQNVGVALTVLSGKDLVNRNVQTVSNLEYQVPSLVVEQAFGSGQPEFRLRGVGFDDYASNNTPTVGVYVDEVAYPIPIMTQGLLFDVSRVEVLRGPQGTLYGRNTTGGAVNVITNKPTDVFHAGATAEYGRFDEYKIEGFVSGPIADGFKARLSATTLQGGGWQHDRTTGRSLGDADRYAGRAQLEWTHGSFDSVWNAHYARDKSEPIGLYLFEPLYAPGGAPITSTTVTVPPDTDYRATGFGISQAFGDIIGKSAGHKPFRDNTSYGFDSNTTVDLGAIKATLIGSYETMKRRELNDWDATQYSESDEYYRSKAQVWSQELRFASATAGPLQWVAGGYWSHQKLKELFLSDFTDYAALGGVIDTSYTQKVDSVAAFGQADYAITSNLKFILGGRLESEDRDLDNFQSSFVGGPAFSSRDHQGTSFTKWSGKAGLEYTPIERVLLYANASRGIKSGGFTAYNSSNINQTNAFKPETLYAYEAGFKTDLISNTLRLNGAAYYYDYRNQQVLSAVYDPLYGPIGRIVNAPKSEIWGGELEAEWTPIRGLRITQAFGYTRGKYKNFNELDIAASTAAGTGVYVSRNGEHFQFPEISYSGSVSYRYEVGGFAVEPEFDYSYRDKSGSLLLGPAFNIDDYWLANASVTLSPADGPWSVSLWSRNVFNTHYDETRNFFLTSVTGYNAIGQHGTPRTYGVRVGYAF